MSESPFAECPDCGADGDWCEDGCCTRCGYDVFEDSDVAEEQEEGDQCAFCGGDLVDDEGGLACPDCEGF